MPADIQARLQKIGKKCGCVSIDILTDIIPEERDSSFIDLILDFLKKNNIKIVETLPEHLKGELGDAESNEEEGPAKNQKLEPAQEVEETTTTYLREMGRFDLLTPAEEEKYSKAIREGFDAIITTIRTDKSELQEVSTLVERIDLWEKRDPTLKPKKQHLNHMRRTVQAIAGDHNDNELICAANFRIGLYTRSIESAKRLDDQGQPSPGGLHCQTLYAPGIEPCRPDPGGQSRPHAGRVSV